MASPSSRPARQSRPRGPRLFRGLALLSTLLVLSIASPSSTAEERDVTASSTSTSTSFSTPTTSSSPDLRKPPRPVVLWHGMGDSCCSPRSMGALSDAIRRTRPGTRVLSLDTSFDGRGATDDDASADVLSSFFGDANRQVDEACRVIRGDDQIKKAGEFDAVGFSQGGLLLRAAIQRCFSSESTSPRAVTLITLGSPHQGVTAFPSCSVPEKTSGDEGQEKGEDEIVLSLPAPSSRNLSSPSLFCRVAEALIARGAYAPGIRTRVIQAQYFKPDSDPDPLGGESAIEEYRRYLELNPFLPRVNGEREEGQEMKNDGDDDEKEPLSHSRRPPRPLSSLRRLVLFRFAEDTVVVPRDSAWFSELRRGRVVPMRETPNFANDVLGLRELDERKGWKRKRNWKNGEPADALLLKTAPGNHMRFTLEWFVDEVVKPFLNEDFVDSVEEVVEEKEDQEVLALS